MNWRLIFLFSLFGFGMGLAATFGLTRKIEPFLWLAIALVVAWVSGSAHVPKPFLHGLLIGIFAGVLAAALEASFFLTYLANNPEAAERFGRSPINPRLLIMLMSPVVGGIFGSVVGLLTWGVGKWLGSSF